ncbi:MAG: serine hydrolase domain-containing protein, partial [Planctomycetota bacterium]
RLEPHIQRTLLQPLGMSRSSYTWNEELARDFAAGHDTLGRLKTGRRFYDRDNAAFSLYTTPSDYARFLIEMMRDDRSAAHSLSAEWVANMLSRQSTKSPTTFHSLGWAITAKTQGELYSHSGSNSSGFRCFSRFDPPNRRGVVIMTNSYSGAALWPKLSRAIDAIQ